MAERRHGPWALLARPWAYEAVQAIFGAEAGRRRFAERHVRAWPGARVLDIGCGTAALARHLGDVAYVGFEPNADYVARGLRENAGRDVRLHAGRFDDAAAAGLAPFDIAIVSAVLHHLEDAEAQALFALLARVLKPGGRAVTLDAVVGVRQSPIARALIGLDRGRNLRTPDGYAALARVSFAQVAGEVVHIAWPPYTHWIMECTAPRSGR